MKKEGFFKFEKRTMVLISIVVLLAIIMFIPSVYNSVTAGGTSYQFILAGAILCVAPLFSLIDGFFRAKNDE